MKVAIVADDLTGSMDAAAPFARRGLATCVVGNALDSETALAGNADIISINADTRHLAPDAAAQITAECISRVARLDPGILFKKIDSSLRGNVASETIAAIRATTRSRAIVTPAMPGQGRTLVNGQVYIRGVLLRDTAIGHDQLNAPPAEPLDDILRAANPGLPVRLVDAGALFTRPGIYVVDCSKDEDLRGVAAALLPIAGDAVVVGAGGLAEALAETAFGSTRAFPEPEPIDGAVVFVIGSRTPEAARQVERLMESFADTCALIDITPGTDLTDGALARAKDAAVVVVRIAPHTKTGDANSIAHNLAVAAKDLLEQEPTSLVAMTGGDTAIAVLGHLGGTTIDVEGEIEAGVVYGSVDLGNRRLRVLTKAGAFGNDDLFVTIARYFGKTTTNVKGQS